MIEWLLILKKYPIKFYKKVINLFCGAIKVIVIGYLCLMAYWGLSTIIYKDGLCYKDNYKNLSNILKDYDKNIIISYCDCFLNKDDIKIANITKLDEIKKLFLDKKDTFSGDFKISVYEKNQLSKTNKHKINFQNKIMVINYNDKHKNLTFK